MQHGDEMSHVCCCLKKWLGFSSSGSCVSFSLPVTAYLSVSVVLQYWLKPLQRSPPFILFSPDTFLPCASSSDSEVRESAAIAALET